MPTPKKGARLGAGPAHQRLMVAGLATQLFEHGRITTTEAKARVLRPVAEKLITKAKKAELGTVQSLHMRREVLKTIRDKEVVHLLFAEIAPRFAERPGGYTRITKIGPRKGDNAPMAVIELVTEDYTATARSTTVPAAPAATAPAAAAPAAEAPAEEVEETTASEETSAAEETDAAAAEETSEQPLEEPSEETQAVATDEAPAESSSQQQAEDDDKA